MPLQGGPLTSVMPQPKPGTARELQSRDIKKKKKIPVEFVHQFLKAKMLCQNISASFRRNHTRKSHRECLGNPRYSVQFTASSPGQRDLGPGPCCVQFPPSITSQTSREQNHWSKTIQGCGAPQKDKPLQSKETRLSNLQLHGLVTAALPVPCASIKLGSTGLHWRIPACSRSGRQLGSLAFFNSAQTLL